MKIDKKLKKPTTELGEKAKKFISELLPLKGTEFTQKLASITIWEFGKSELCLWADVLNQMDEILQRAAARKSENSVAIICDLDEHTSIKGQVLDSLKFTALLFEYSFTRGVYMSMEHLITLLESSDIEVVSAVLNVLYVSSKRTSYLGSLPSNQKEALLSRLTSLAESWGGREAGYSIAECCSSKFAPLGRPATTLHFEFYDESEVDCDNAEQNAGQINRVHYVHIDHVDQLKNSAGEIMDDILRVYKIPENKRMHLLTQLRWAQSFGDFKKRACCINTRLLSLSVLIYSNMLQENSHNLLYNGFIEECVQSLQLEDSPLVLDIKTEILKTLTAIIYLDRNPKLNAVIEATGASAYHGYLPTLVRNCIDNFIEEKPISSPNYVIALFSLLYHMAGYDSGAEALISSALTESLLKLVNWTKCPIDYVIYLTRAVRIIDLITNVNSQAFQSLDGMTVFINRLAHEVDLCRAEEPHQIDLPKRQISVNENASSASPSQAMLVDATSLNVDHEQDQQQGTRTANAETDSSATATSSGTVPATSIPEPQSTIAQLIDFPAPLGNVQCCSQRLVLIKSLLNFVKKAISDQQFSENIRHIMDGSLPNSLRHIISNPDYYGSMLFLRAIVVITVFINQEPSQLTSLQEKGITDVIMHALLVKEIPASREVLSHLPQAFSALCLNERGLNAFMSCNPFEKLFKVLLSTKYLNAMRKRRNSDSVGDTAISLGAAIDEIMRHQPTLKTKAMEAVIKLLEELCSLGSSAKYSCSPKTGHRIASSAQLLADGPATQAAALLGGGGQGAGASRQMPMDGVANATGGGGGAADVSSEEDDDDEEDSRQPMGAPDDDSNFRNNLQTTNENAETKVTIPLVEYVQNVMKLIEAILSNNSTDDHARLFIQLKGLPLLMKILTLPNLPADFGVHSACHNVATVIRYLLSLTRDNRVLQSLLQQMNEPCLKSLATLRITSTMELGQLSHFVEDALKLTNQQSEEVPDSPLFRSMGQVLSHLVVLNHINRLGTNNDLKALILGAWSEKNGDALSQLDSLYRVVLWENVILHSMENKTAPKADQAKEAALSFVDSNGKDLVKSDTQESLVDAMDVDVQVPCSSTKIEHATPILGYDRLKPYAEMSLKVSRHLSELFNLLTKVSVGGMTRSRRGQTPFAMLPSANGLSTVDRLMNYGRVALDWQPALDPKFTKQWLTYLVSQIDYITQLLFDERKQAYHMALSKFYSTGLQHTFFKLLGRVIETLKRNGQELNDAHSQFPLAWLTLAEKLVNAQCITESTYQYLESTGTGSFNADLHLAITHKMACDEIVEIWDTVTNINARVSDLVLTLMCHILKGDISEDCTKSSKDSEPKKKDEQRNTIIDQLNQAHLQHLMDMGFSRDAAAEALLSTRNVDQAADYLLNMSYAPARAVSFGTIQFSVFDEEEQIRRAIEMSLGAPPEPNATSELQDAMLTPGVASTAAGIPNSILEQSDPSLPLVTTVLPSKSIDIADPNLATTPANRLVIYKPSEAPTLRTSDLNRFLNERLLNCWLLMIDAAPELVYRLADLLSVAINKASKQWTETMLNKLGEEVINYSKKLEKICTETTMSELEKNRECCESKTSAALAIRLHLLCLLLEEFKLECCELIARLNLHSILVKLFEQSSQIMQIKCTSSGQTSSEANLKTTKWLAPLLLCLDAYDRECTTLRYRMEARNMENIAWKYWDNRNWSTFTGSVAKQITDAFKSGAHTLKFTNNRRRYMIDFVSMVQMNLDSAYQRPVIFLPGKPEESVQTDTTTASSNGKLEKVVQKPVEATTSKVPDVTPSFVLISNDERRMILKSIVNLIESSVDADTLHAALRLCLRLTRDYSLALEFLELGGVLKLLRLKQYQSFAGLPSLLSLIVRHIVEDEHVLKQTMERVVKHVVQGGVATLDAPGNPNELYYIFRLLGGVACRDETIFVNTVKNMLRIKVPPPRKSDDDETALLNPNLPIEVRLETTAAHHSTLGAASKEVLTRLLNYLATKHDLGDEANADKKDLPLVQKYAILKLIAELTRSYYAVAQFVADYRYTPACGDLITEECTALGFFFDQLLLDTKSVTGLESDCSTMGVRAVVATMAASNHCEDAQCALVTELKHALQRAMSLNECKNKHIRLCSLVSLVSLMKDTCPNVQMTTSTAPNTPGAKTASGTEKQPGTQTTSRANNIVKWFVKKRLLADLARIPHSLDMRSPYFTLTVNSALKPLEELSRLVNAPSSTTQNPFAAAAARQRRASSRIVSTNIDANGQMTVRTGTAANGANPRDANGEMNVDDLSFVLNNGSMPLIDAAETPASQQAAADNVTPATTTGLAASLVPQSEDTSIAVSVSVSMNRDADTNQAAAPGGRQRRPLPPHRRRHPAGVQRTVAALEAAAGQNIEASIILNSLESMESGTSSSSDDEHSSAASSSTTSTSSLSGSGGAGGAPRRRPRALTAESTSSEHADDDEDDDEAHHDDDGGGSAGEDEDDAGHDEDAVAAAGGVAAPVADDGGGNERGSEQDEEAASEYEDVEEDEDDDEDEDDEALDEVDEDMDDTSEFDEAADAMQIDLNDTMEDAHDSFGILGDILRGSLNQNRFDNRDVDRVYLTTFGGNNLAMPDVEHYLTAGTAFGLTAPVLGMLSSTHPLLIRHADSPLANQNQAATSGASGAAGVAATVQTTTGGAANQLGDWWGRGGGFGGAAPAIFGMRNAGALDQLNMPRRLNGAGGGGLLRQNAVRHHNHRTYRYIVSAPGANDPSSVLQRILGPGIAQELLTIVPQSTTFGQSGFFASEDQVPDFEPSDSGLGRRLGVLASVPNAYVRWCDEARILYGDSVHYVIAAHRSGISSKLEECRETEFVARKARRAGMAEEEKRFSDAAAQKTTTTTSTTEAQVSSKSDNLQSAQEPTSQTGSSVETAQTTVAPCSDSTAPASPSPMDTAFFASATSLVDANSTGVAAAQESAHDATMTASSSSQDVFVTASDTMMSSMMDSSIVMTAPETMHSEMTKSESQLLETAASLTAETTPSSQTTPVAGPSNETGQPATPHAEPAADAFPEGVDPAFLAALPENIRQEVIADQLRLQRLRAQNQQRAAAAAEQSSAPNNTTAAAAVAAAEVSPEFLAALPPELQEEVLAQQRLAQQMLNPPAADAPFDPVTFMETLPPGLRQQVLADADDSQIALLPAHLAQEARRLRSQFEMQQAHHLMARQMPFVNLLSRRRDPALGGRYAVRPGGRGHQLIRSTLSALTRGADQRYQQRGSGAAAGSTSQTPRGGQQLLDKEAVCCLLVLFFIDDQRLMLGRVHRILRSLCYHAPTRDWVIRALLSILEKAQSSAAEAHSHKHSMPMEHQDLNSHATDATKSTTPQQSIETSGLDDRLSCGTRSSGQLWLNATLSESMSGRKMEIFEMTRRASAAAPAATQTSTSLKRHHVPQGVATGATGVVLKLHPQAAVNVCRHVIDTLIILAKGFPIAFFPTDLQERLESVTKLNTIPAGVKTAQNPTDTSTTGGATTPATTESTAVELSTATNEQKPQQGQKSAASAAVATAVHQNQQHAIKSDYWDLLVKLDASFGTPPTTGHVATPRKVSIGLAGKSQASTGTKTATAAPSSIAISAFEPPNTYSTLNESPFGQLTSVLKYDVVSSNETLTDSLLRLLLLAVNFLPSVSDHVNALQPTWVAAALKENSNTSLLPHLADLVEIVTRGKLNEDCLEQGRGVLLRAAQVFGEKTREAIFMALVESASKLGTELCAQLKRLLNEINVLHATRGDDQLPGPSSVSLIKPPSQPVIHLPSPTTAGRFGGPAAKTVVQNASNKELQLPAMCDLTSKASIQQCLLRTLNTLITLRDSGISEQKKTGKVAKTQLGPGSLAITNQPTVTPTNDTLTVEPMEVDNAPTEKAGSSSSLIDPDSSLSRFLPMCELWDFLGECLKRLTEASDPHVVLVLQPAVEAFFLVHACRRKEKAQPGKEAAPARVDVGERLGSVGGQQQGAAGGAAAAVPSESQQRQPADHNVDVITEPVSPAPALVESLSISFYQPQDNLQVAPTVGLPDDVEKFVKFAEEHRNVLNQILRQSTEHLADGPFAVLVDYTRILDFDVKRRYFRKELERSDDGYRRDDAAVRVRRDHVFQDSFRELFRLRANEWKSRFYIIFEGEEGQDAGGLLREWFSIITREIFNPDYALFQTAPGDRVTYMINPSSYINIEHLDYFKFVGRLIAKAIYDNKLLDCFFTRAFYKHILGKQVKYNDLESEDPSFYQSLVFLLENPVDVIGNDITFSLEVTEFGKYEVRDLKPNGRNLAVTEENKREYVRLVCQMKMTGAIRQQLNAFLTGFYDIIPRQLISIFNEQEMELLISGLPNIDVDDLQQNTEYNKYTKTSLQIQWFWRALRSFDQADRAKFLQFVTGTSKVPLQGFAALEGMHGVQRFQIHRDDRSTERLPTAHTCFNQLDLPPYETYDKLRDYLLLAIRECTEGFGFA